jgi:hypothetical protein
MRKAGRQEGRRNATFAKRMWKAEKQEGDGLGTRRAVTERIKTTLEAKRVIAF